MPVACCGSDYGLSIYLHTNLTKFELSFVILIGFVCDFQVFCEDHYFNIASNCLFFFDLIISFVYMIVELQGIGCKIQSCLNL